MPSNGNPGCMRRMRTVLPCRAHGPAEASPQQPQHSGGSAALPAPQLVTFTTSAGCSLWPYFLKKELSSSGGKSCDDSALIAHLPWTEERFRSTLIKQSAVGHGGSDHCKTATRLVHFAAIPQDSEKDKDHLARHTGCF